ncbi:MAG: SLC13 family permease [Acidobacteriota bacterium]
MSLEIVLLGAIILAAVLLFAFDVFPVDKTSILVLGSLVALRLITPEQAVSGFGNTATVTVAAMLALSYGIQRTGGLNFVANKIVDLSGGSESRVLLSLLAAVGLLSAFINNTAAVAIFLPLTIALAREQNLDASKLLMPMSFAAMFAGTCTLIGTSTNLLVYSLVLREMNWQIGMFEFTQMGLIFSGAGALYLIVVGRKLIPSRRTAESLTEDYRLRHFVTELILSESSPLIGKSIEETGLREQYDVEVIEIIRDRSRLLPTAEEATLRAGDILLVQGEPTTLMKIQKDQPGILLKALTVEDRDLEDENIVLLEAFISPTSRLIESTLKEINFRRTFKANAIAIRSHGRTIREKIGTTRLEFGDSLLIVTNRQQLDALRHTTDFLMAEEVRVRLIEANKVYYAMTIFMGIIAAAALNIMTVLEASIVGVGLMLVTGCLRLRELYHNISWQTIIMLATLIPLGVAMENTGMAELIADHLVVQLRDLGPVAVLSGMYLTTALLTSIMSNNATAVLMVPISISAAQELQVDARPLIFAVMFAASASFITPIGYQTNTFIFGPGGYKFSDFFRVGAPLTILFWLLASLFIPIFWPF